MCAQAFDALFELFDVDHNGEIDMRECVVGLAVLGNSTTAVQKLEWLFDVFRCFASIVVLCAF